MQEWAKYHYDFLNGGRRARRITKISDLNGFIHRYIELIAYEMKLLSVTHTV